MKQLVYVITFIFISINFTCNSQSNATILKQLFVGSEDILYQVEELISLSVDAVWYASSVTEQETFTGTLSQSSTNPDQWMYSFSPTDKLILNYVNGDLIQFVFTSMNGFKDGSSYDFKRSHNMDFTASTPEKSNLRIQSQIGPENGKIYWTRVVSGNTVIEGISLSVNLINTGNNNEEIDHGFAFGDYINEASGTVKISDRTYTINEKYITKIGHNSNAGIYMQTRELINNNSVSGNFGSFRFENAHCFWLGGTTLYAQANEGIFNRVIEDYNWSAGGSLYRNNEIYGHIKYDRTIVNNSNGAYIIADCNDEQEYYLLPALLPDLITISEEETFASRILFIYPNPFQKETAISFSLHESTNVELTIYDQNGKKVRSLLSAYLQIGNYKIPFLRNSLKSGAYYCQLVTNSGSISTRLIIL